MPSFGPKFTFRCRSKNFMARVSSDSIKVRPLSETWQTIFSRIPERIGLNKSFMLLLSFCLPICGPCNQAGISEHCKPVMVCLPCQPDLVKTKEKVKEPKPIGLITRNKDMELFKGKLVYKCTCGKRNGLTGGTDCPRMSCVNNPGCSMIPPQCWPQFPDPPKPPTLPEQKMICVPVELIYYDPSQTA